MTYPYWIQREKDKAEQGVHDAHVYAHICHLWEKEERKQLELKAMLSILRRNTHSGSLLPLRKAGAFF